VFPPKYSIMVMEKLDEKNAINMNRKRRGSPTNPSPLIKIDNNTLKRSFETFRYKQFLDKANMYKSGAAAYGISLYALISCFLTITPRL
jgi:hypothetical protein